MVGYAIQLPAIIHVPLTLLIACLGGAIWGGFAGWLKSKFGINEVIAAIMLNWIHILLQACYLLSVELCHYLSTYVTIL